MRPDIDKGGRTSIMRADIVDGKKIRIVGYYVGLGGFNKYYKFTSFCDHFFRLDQSTLFLFLFDIVFFY